MQRHLREIPIDDLPAALAAAGFANPTGLAQRLAVAVHQRGATAWEELGVGRRPLGRLQAAFAFGPLLELVAERSAADRTRKLLFRTRSKEVFEVVLIHNLKSVTACLSSQAGCALGCRFCATGTLGLQRHLTAGEISESLVRAEQIHGRQISDIVFMGQGEPLHNYDGVMAACDVFAHAYGNRISKRRLTVSTSGLTPQIHRFVEEARPWRLHLSLHSAIQATRERIMPIARTWPLDGVLEAMRRYQRERDVPWVTLQYIALPGINMDARHVDALEQELTGLRFILDVIPYNDIADVDAGLRAPGDDAGRPFRSPTWSEVKAFTTALRRLACPVKIRYSAGKQEGMGCGQLAAETRRLTPGDGHMIAPPGIFSA